MNKNKRTILIICGAAFLLIAVFSIVMLAIGTGKKSEGKGGKSETEKRQEELLIEIGSDDETAGSDDVSTDAPSRGESGSGSTTQSPAVSDKESESTGGSKDELVTDDSPGMADDGDTPVSSEPDKSDTPTTDKKPNGGSTEAGAITPPSTGNEDTPTEGGSSDKADDSTSTEQPPSKEPSVPKPMKYADYIKMTPKEQQEYFLQFENYEDYFVWYDAAKAEYEKENPSIEVGGGAVDVGDIINGAK